MAVDSGDYDNDGRLDLLVTTYAGQQASLYHNDGAGLFTVTSSETQLGPPTLPYVKFGAGFVDLDNDGWLDIIMTSGHVRDNIKEIDASQSYSQPIQVFHNEHGRFVDVSESAGIAGLRAVGRGLAFADYDRDGKVDVLVCNHEGEAILLHNVSSTQNRWLDVRLQGTGGNRSGLGARLTLTANGTMQLREIRTCGSVLSARDPVAHFGLGTRAVTAELTIRWPDGKDQHIHIGAVNTTITVRR